MVPLNSSLTSSTAEDLQISRRSSNAQRAEPWRLYLCLGTWNVRSLLDMEGSVENVRHGIEDVNAEDRRIDLVVRELGRYRVKVAATQETKWFGNAVYRVGESVVLTAGRPAPGPEQSKQRGVVIVLTDYILLCFEFVKSRW